MSGHAATSWRFHCSGCSEQRTELFSDLDAEREAAVSWVRVHAAHGLGGFITPDEVQWCENCHEWHHRDRYRGKR